MCWLVIGRDSSCGLEGGKGQFSVFHGDEVYSASGELDSPL